MKSPLWMKAETFKNTKVQNTVNGRLLSTNFKIHRINGREMTEKVERNIHVERGGQRECEEKGEVGGSNEGGETINRTSSGSV